MDAALLGVIGTLSGVIVTAIVGLVGTVITGRNQRLSVELHLRTTRTDRLRDERRAAFLQFLTAYAALREKILMQHRECLRVSPGETGRLKPADYAVAEAGKFIQVCHLMRISCSDPIGLAAQSCADELWDLGDQYYVSEADFDIRWAAARTSRRKLERAMRDELIMESETER